MPLSQPRFSRRRTPCSARLRRYLASAPASPLGGLMESPVARRRRAILLVRILKRDGQPTPRLHVPIVRAGHPTLGPGPSSDRGGSVPPPPQDRLPARH